MAHVNGYAYYDINANGFLSRREPLPLSQYEVFTLRAIAGTSKVQALVKAASSVFEQYVIIDTALDSIEPINGSRFGYAKVAANATSLFGYDEQGGRLYAFARNPNGNQFDPASAATYNVVGAYYLDSPVRDLVANGSQLFVSTASGVIRFTIDSDSSLFDRTTVVSGDAGRVEVMSGTAGFAAVVDGTVKAYDANGANPRPVFAGANGNFVDSAMVGNRIYAVSATDNGLYVIDKTSLALVTRIDLSETPKSLVFAADAGSLYVSTATGVLTFSVAADGSLGAPTRIAADIGVIDGSVTLGSQRLFATSTGIWSFTVSGSNLSDGKRLVAGTATALRTAVGQSGFAARIDGSDIVFAANGTFVRTVTTVSDSAVNQVASAGGGRTIVFQASSQTLLTLDANGLVVGIRTAPADVRDLAITADGTTLYVATGTGIVRYSIAGNGNLSNRVNLINGAVTRVEALAGQTGFAAVVDGVARAYTADGTFDRRVNGAFQGEFYKVEGSGTDLYAVMGTGNRLVRVAADGSSTTISTIGGAIADLASYAGGILYADDFGIGYVQQFNTFGFIQRAVTGVRAIITDPARQSYAAVTDRQVFVLQPFVNAVLKSFDTTAASAGVVVGNPQVGATVNGLAVLDLSGNLVRTIDATVRIGDAVDMAGSLSGFTNYGAGHVVRSATGVTYQVAGGTIRVIGSAGAVSQVLTNGQLGIDGILKPRDAVLSANGAFLVVAGEDAQARDTIVAFEVLADGRLGRFDITRDGADAIEGIRGVTRLEAIAGNQIRVATLIGTNGLLGGLAVLQLPERLPDAADATVRFEGIEALSVRSTGNATDNVTVSARPIGVATLSIETGAGADAVTVLEDAPSTIIDTGDGNDTVKWIDQTTNGGSTIVRLGAGNDRIVITRDGGGLIVEGGEGNDTFLVSGSNVSSGGITLRGDAPTGTPDGDTLLYDALRENAVIGPIVNGKPASDGTASVAGAGTVTYANMEAVDVVSAPQIGGFDAATGREGEGVTLTVRNIVVFGAANIDGTARFDLNGDARFDAVATVRNGQAQVTLSWEDLVRLGIDDNGTYTVTVEVENSLGLTSSVTSTLTLVEAISANFQIAPQATRVGDTVSIQALVSDPGDDRTVFSVDWGDGSDVQTFVATSGQPSHVYTKPGSFTIAIAYSNEDSALQQITGTVTVALPVSQITLDARGSASGKATTIAEGDALVLSATAPGGPSAMVYRINGIAVSGSPTDPLVLSWSDLAAFGIDRSGTYQVTVTPDYAGTTFASQSLALTVTNTAPTATLSAIWPGPAVEGGTVRVAITNPTDVAAGDRDFLYRFDLNGDGDFEDAGETDFTASSTVDIVIPTMACGCSGHRSSMPASRMR